MASPLVSIVIPHFDERELLRECLNGFNQRRYDPVELIVVDGGSEDGSKAMVEDEFPEVTLLEAPPNVSFGRANNIGLRHASGDILSFTFNNDEVIEPGWIEKIVEVLESRTEIGIASGIRLRYNDRDVLDSAGITYNVFGKQRNYSGRKHDALQKDQLHYVDFVEVPVFRREVLEDVGYIDEDYEFYGEDVDFCLRVKKCGYEIVVVSDAITYHHRGATTQQSVQARYYMERSRLRMFLKLFCVSKLPPTLLYWCLVRLPPKSILILLGYGVKDSELGPVERLHERGRHVLMLYAAIWWNLCDLPTTLRERAETDCAQRIDSAIHE